MEREQALMADRDLVMNVLLVPFVCVTFGISQWVAGDAPWVLALLPLAVVLPGLVYGAAYVGQGLGSDQMFALRAFLERAV